MQRLSPPFSEKKRAAFQQIRFFDDSSSSSCFLHFFLFLLIVGSSSVPHDPKRFEKLSNESTSDFKPILRDQSKIYFNENSDKLKRKRIVHFNKNKNQICKIDLPGNITPKLAKQIESITINKTKNNNTRRPNYQ